MKSLFLITFFVVFSTPTNAEQTNAEQIAICENILFKKDKTSICRLNDLNEDNAKAILVVYFAIEKLSGAKKPDFLAMDTSKPICLNDSFGLHNCKGGK